MSKHFDTHADWCEHLYGLGQLATDHRYCPDTAYCVASSRRQADAEAARRQVEGHRIRGTNGTGGVRW